MPLTLKLSQDPEVTAGVVGESQGATRESDVPTLTRDGASSRAGPASWLLGGVQSQLFPTPPGADSLSGSPAAEPPQAAGNWAVLFWERAAALGRLAAADILAPSVSTLFSPLMIRQSSAIKLSSEPLMAYLRALMAAVATLKWDLAMNSLYFSPAMQKPLFLLSLMWSRPSVFRSSSYPPCYINPFPAFLAYSLRVNPVMGSH